MHALQLGPIREREDPANELPEGWKPMLRTGAKFRRYTDAHNYYIPNNGELHNPAKRRSGEAARYGDNRRRRITGAPRQEGSQCTTTHLYRQRTQQ